MAQSSETTDSKDNANASDFHFMVPTTFEDLEYIIDNCPIIDNHAHPLLQKQTSAGFANAGVNLLSITSEATGRALQDASSTLAHRRAFKTLRENFVSQTTQACDDWEDWEKFRDAADEKKFTRDCLKGLQTILIDDGLRYPQGVHAHPYDWHDQYLKTAARRIVRLETLAEDLILEHPTLNEWEDGYNRAITDAHDDPAVVGFKSVIAYRTGLDCNLAENDPNILPQAITNAGISSFGEFLRTTVTRPLDDTYAALRATVMDQRSRPRINDVSFNNYILFRFANIMTSDQERGIPFKPLQLHTGFGDNDLSLKDSNPIHLTEFIRNYPQLPIVLLHAGYPYTREAGYLASVYPNVYLDFGLVFPKVSQAGQESVLKQLLEVTPSSKAMWSTDGVYFAETYYLGIQQVRAAMKAVMAEMHDRDSVSLIDMASVITDVFFNTANKLYGLDLELYTAPPTTLARPMETLDDSPLAGKAKSTYRGKASLKVLKKFLRDHKHIEYIHLNWVDYSAIVRTRVVKVKQVIKQLEQNENGSIIGVAKASLYLLANCAMVPGGSAIGEWRLVPDFSSIRLHPHKNDGEKKAKEASVMCWLEDEEQKPVDLCPRTILARSISRAKESGLSDFKIGFEIEFVMLEQSKLDEGKLIPITTNHTWSTSRALQSKALTILKEIDKTLDEAGIEIEQFHSEAAKGQFEIVLSPLPPLEAVDTLNHTREVMQYVCAKHGYRASLIPKPFENECGSAAHMHISFKPVEKQWSFFAGVLKEIGAINAFSLGSEISYERIIAGFWAGGLWACWGRQNREAPVRLVEEDKAHWEVKTIDGMANMYLAIAGILTAGTIGVKDEIPIFAECNEDASKMTDSEREDRGITAKMVKSMDEALAALFEDEKGTPTRFSRKLGSGVASHQRAVKNAEKELLLHRFGYKGYLDKLGIDSRRAWAAQWY